MVVGHEAGNAVEWIRDDLYARRKSNQQLALVGDFFAGEAHLQLVEACRMQGQINTERRRDGLPRVIIRRIANAAAGKHHVASGHRPLERGGQPFTVVAEILDPAQAQATRAEQFGDLGKMLVLTFARQDFIADDDGAKGTAHSLSPSMVTMAPPRDWRRASSP